MKIKRLLFIISCMVALVSTTSCVDERYDLDNVSGEIHLFENGVALPLLQTGDLYFDDLISSEDEIVLNEKGVYEISTSSEVLSVEMQIVDKVRISEQNPDFGVIKSYNAIIPTGSVTFELPSDLTDYNANLHCETAKIDEKVTYIEKIYTHDNWVSTIKFEVLDGSGNPISSQTGLKVDKIKFDNYKLELPSVLIMDKEQITTSGNINVTTDDNSNVIVLNGEAFENSVVIGVKINGVTIGEDMFVNNKIILDEEVSLNGAISLSVSNSGAMVEQTLQIAPTLNIPEVYIDEALGNTTMSDELENERVYIGELPDFLNNPETSLILTNPYIPIVIETTVPMDTIYADIVLVPKDESGNNIYNENGEKIEIEVNHIAVPGDDHETPGATIIYEYVACQRIPELDNLGYDFVECLELGTITQKIPSYIEVSGRGYTDPNHIYNFYMGELYHADINYEVRVPFMVEQNTCIVYEDVTSDLNTDLFEVISASSIILNAEILNGFPAEMSLSVEPFDVDGNKIEGLEVMIPSKINASETTELTENVVPAKTNMRIEIRELVKGEMQKLDQLKWRVKVLFPDKGLVSIYQALNMKIALELPEGFGINMDNLEN